MLKRDVTKLALTLGLVLTVALVAAGCSGKKKQTTISGAGGEDDVVVIGGDDQGFGGAGGTSEEIDFDDLPPRDDMDKDFGGYGTALTGSGADLLPTIYFDYDRSVLRQDQMDALEENAAWILQNPNYKVLLEGHCDERGTSSYNMALGQRRADAVFKFLLEQGVPMSRVNTVSYGEERPAVVGSNEAAWAKNRRVEFRVRMEPSS